MTFPHNERFFEVQQLLEPIRAKLMGSAMARTLEIVGVSSIAELARLASQAVKRGDFTLTSGKKSDFYFDGRQITMSAPALKWIIEIVMGLVYGDPSLCRVNAIGGPATAAIPISSAVLAYAATANSPRLAKAFYVRSEPKAHGVGNLIEGPSLGKDDVVLLVDDTLTTGGSLIKAAKAVLETGATIAAVFVLVDREEGGAEAIEKEIGGRPYAALTKTLLFFAMDNTDAMQKIVGR